MTSAQIVAMKLALSSIEKPEEQSAYIGLISGQELANGDCRALLTACARNGVSDESDVKELAEHFFNRYDFNDKVKIDALGRITFG